MINLSILLFLYFIQLEPQTKKTKITKMNTFHTFIGININIIKCHHTQRTKFQTMVASNLQKEIEFFNFRNNMQTLFNMVVSCLFSLTTSMKKRRRKHHCGIFSLCGTTGYIPQSAEFFRADKAEEKNNVTVQLIIKIAGTSHVYLPIMSHNVT